VLMENQLPLALDRTADVQQHSLVVMAGDSFSLSCSSAVPTTFRLGYSPLGSRRLMIIYNGVKINDNFRISAKVSVRGCDERNCAFDVRDFQLDEAGVLACMRRAVRTYWSVTTLGK